MITSTGFPQVGILCKPLTVSEKPWMWGGYFHQADLVSDMRIFRQKILPCLAQKPNRTFAFLFLIHVWMNCSYSNDPCMLFVYWVAPKHCSSTHQKSTRKQKKLLLFQADCTHVVHKESPKQKKGRNQHVHCSLEF